MSLAGITNFLVINERLATAGQPTAEQLPSVQEAGYRVVINLAMPDSPSALKDECALVEDLRMRYIAQPVVWTAPTPEDVRQFFNTMHEHRNEKVFVHCAMNMRVSAFVYLYRVKVQGVAEPVAQVEMQRIWTPNETWQALIDEVLQLSG